MGSALDSCQSSTYSAFPITTATPLPLGSTLPPLDPREVPAYTGRVEIPTQLTKMELNRHMLKSISPKVLSREL